jgi:hypothetical protein
MSMQAILADLHNTRTLLEAEQQRRQSAEDEVARLRNLCHTYREDADENARHLVAVRAEVARLREERRSLWCFVKPEEGVPVVYVGVHVVRWYEAAGEYEPTAGFVRVEDEE